MKKFIKENFVIVLAFILPIGFIFFITVKIYLPSLFLSTDYSFVYSSCVDYCYDSLQNRYSVVDGKIVDSIDSVQGLGGRNLSNANENFPTRIFFHDTKENKSREITLEEAQTFVLSGLLTSPDEVTISGKYNRGPDFLFFRAGSSYDYYLMRGENSSKLNLINNVNYYGRNFQFIGWVIPEVN